MKLRDLPNHTEMGQLSAEFQGKIFLTEVIGKFPTDLSGARISL